MRAVLERELISVRELMDLSGESEACWRKRLSKGELSYIKLGENVRVRRSDLERWLESRTVRKGHGA
jgi:excisionase family DNA binding protein